MNVKYHVLRRYCQRLLKIDERDIKEYIIKNKEDLTKDILNLFNNSKHIWCGIVGEHEISNFYIVNNICIICDKDNQNIITLYNLDYGFDNEINNNIVKSLLQKINKIDKDIEKNKLKHNTVLIKKQSELLKTKEIIKTLESQLEILNNKVNCIVNDIQMLNQDMNYQLLEKEKIIKQLVYSIYFKIDLLENRNLNLKN